jgi:hypothetical protein
MFTFAQRICVFAFAAAGLFVQPMPAQSTPTPVSPTRTSGMIGIVDGQFARVNALNPGVAAPATAVTCTATLEFVDGAGTLLKSKTVSVAPGKSMYLDIFGDVDLMLAGLDRREIRAVITMPLAVPASAASPTNAATCKLIGTLELVDEPSGRTQEVLGVVHPVPPAPVPTNPS